MWNKVVYCGGQLWHWKKVGALLNVSSHILDIVQNCDTPQDKESDL